jgi:CheY-like chemotaxis protein
MVDKLHILLVEDNEGDILLTKEALAENKIVTDLSVVRDGEAALKFLEKKEPFANAGSPNIILLDINLPKVDGKEVLGFIKKNEKLKHIPVIMLTTSSLPTDIIEAYNRQANCYITKPVELDKFLDAVRSFEDFWVSIVQLPPACP